MQRKTSGVPWRAIAIVGGCIAGVLWLQPWTLIWGGSGPDIEEIRYSELRDLAADGKVDEMTWTTSGGAIDGVLADGTEFRSDGPGEPPEDDLRLFRRHDVDLGFTEPPDSSNLLVDVVMTVLIYGALIGLVMFATRGVSGTLPGRFRGVRSERPDARWSDIAGYDNVKREVQEVVDFLRDSSQFTGIGARIPKGVLLSGPPGTGKTLIARAAACEAGVPFISVTGSDFAEMYVGVGAKRVRDLFRKARHHGRAIIFIDEIDSLGRKRSADGHDGESDRTLNQLLSEMDGFDATDGIVVMAATNRPDVLDSALLRPGRFDREIVVPLPETRDRHAILEAHTRGIPLDADTDLGVVARTTSGMSGAGLANLVNEAALHALRSGHDTIGQSDLDAAHDRVLMGQRHESIVLSDAEKLVTAYHEAGHAVCAAVLPDAAPVHKVTILPIGRALGVTQQLPDERHLYQKAHIWASIVVCMGGRCAEELAFNDVSTGASNDLMSATELARKMVTEWGMSAGIGPRAWHPHDGPDTGPGYSDGVAAVIDDEIHVIVIDAKQRALDTLKAHRNALDLVAGALLEHETVDGAEILRLVKVAGSDRAATARPELVAVPAAGNSAG